MSGADPRSFLPEFIELSDETLQALVSRSEPVSFGPGHQILRDDERSPALFLITDGFVEVTWRGENRRAPLHVELGPGSVIGEDALGGTGSVGASSIGSVQALRLLRDDAMAIAAEHADFGLLVAAMNEIQGKRSWLVAQLRRAPLFRHVAPADLTELLIGAHLVEAGPHEQLADGREPLAAIMVVMEGEVLIRPTGKQRIGRRTYTPRTTALGRGAVVGDEAIVDDQPLLQDVSAGADGARVLRLQRGAFNRVFLGNLAFRRAVMASPALDDATRQSLLRTQVMSVPPTEQRPFVAVVGDGDVGAGTLVQWLAEAGAREFGDQILIVQPTPGFDGPPTPDTGETYDNEGWVWRLQGPADVQEALAIGASMLAYADAAVLDLSSLTPAQARPWLAMVQRLVVVTTTPYRPTEAQLPTDIMGDRLPLYTAVVPAPTPAPDDVLVVPFGTLRLHRDVIDAARRGVALDDLDERLKRQVYRWARGVSGRRFGVALGGGGALSWAEGAVLQRLHEAGIPIDMVAGVSGGAVVGAFYAAGQDLVLPPDLQVADELRDMPGLALLSVLGDELERAQSLGILSGAAVARFLEKHLPHTRLEDLDPPFYPVAVDADQAVQTSLRVGPVAFGTRASASFPGTFTPTTLDLRELEHWWRRPWRKKGDIPSREPDERTHTRWLDGGLLNNIPDDSLYLEGAQLVMACNVVPAPTPRAQTSGPFFLKTQERFRKRSGAIPRFVREFEPITRFDDLLRAVYMLLFQPADWDARTADVKYEATTQGFTFLDWSKADEIRGQALEGERGAQIDKLVDEVRAHRERLKWARFGEGGDHLTFKMQLAGEVIEAIQEAQGAED